MTDEQIGADDIPPMRRVASAVFVFAVVVCVWAIFAPSPYGLCVGVLIALPPIAVVMVAVSGKQLKFVNPAGEITTYAFLIILLTSIAVVYRSTDIHMLTLFAPAPYAAILGLAFVGAVAWIDWPARHIRLLVTMLALGCVWGWGCASYADMAFDSAPRQIFRPTITAYSISRGAGKYQAGGAIRHVVVDPWGPFDQSSDMVVTEALYSATQRGVSLCVALGRGMLGWSYYSIVECPRR